MQMIKWTGPLMLICFLSCNQNATKGNFITDTIKEKKSRIGSDRDLLLSSAYVDGMVISCGSGCAMQYNVIEFSGEKSKIKVKFSVQMFEDEKETDNYAEDFLFYYSKENTLLKIIRDGQTESFLETQMPHSQREFKNFAHRLSKEVRKHTLEYK